MPRVLVLFVGLSLWMSARSECIATGYVSGTPVPRYLVTGTTDLTALWDEYASAYGDSARLSYITELAGELADVCLAQVALADPGKLVGNVAREEFIIERPCAEVHGGRRVRLMVYDYCVELFGRDPDFYTTLPYRHARPTWKRRV